MTLPGPNQTRTSDRRPRDLLAHLARPRIKRPAEIFAAALQIDPGERDKGYQDGLEAARFDIGSKDPLSYGTGYIIGIQERRRRRETEG